MKKIILFVVCIIVLGATIAYFYWQNNKKTIIKDAILSSISDKTDSLYFLQYDSSRVDEINGEAYFENILLQHDSIQKQKLISKDSLPNILINISIKSLFATGIDIPLAINEKKISAEKIIINNPIITLFQTEGHILNKQDTLAIYKKLLGNYKSIYAKKIEINNAVFENKTTTNRTDASVQNLNIVLENIKVDSTKDYTNVFAYFIKNMRATAESISLKKPKGEEYFFAKIAYNAYEKKLIIDKVETKYEGKLDQKIILNNIVFDDLGIDDFIENQILSIGSIHTGSSTLTIFLNEKDKNKSSIKNIHSFNFPDDFFEQIKIGALSIGKSNLILKNKQHPEKEPIYIQGFSFLLSNKIKISERNSLRYIIDNAKWNMKADEIKFSTKDKLYHILIKGIDINKGAQTAAISSFQLKPTLSETQFVNQLKFQKDMYNLDLKNIFMSDIEINRFINEKMIIAKEAKLQFNLNVYHDRNLPEDPKSKVGNYPHQLISKIDIPLFFQQIKFVNSYAQYRERSSDTKKVGNIFFSNISGTVQNVTNMKDKLVTNSICRVEGTGLLLGVAKCNTKWNLYLNANDGKFDMTGKISTMNLSSLDVATKPLALTTLHGNLNQLTFDMKGNDYQANGDISMLYNNLKLESFSLDEDSKILKEKKLKSIINNTFVINDNPKNGNTRVATFSFERDIHKSFFNLIWKSIYDGVQKIILNKKVAELKKKLK